MDTNEIINLIIGILGLILGGVANIRINSYKSTNKTGDLYQKGIGNKQAGRDIKE
jgi:hypothetical protein